MKFFLLFILASALTFGPAAAQTSAEAISNSDSVAYATGVVATAIIKQQLSEYSATVKCDGAIKAFAAAFSDPQKVEVQIKELRAQMAELQSSMVATQFAQQVRDQVDSTLTVSAILDGIQDSWSDKATLQPTEANNMIIAHIDTLAKIKCDKYLATVDSIPDIQKSQTGLRYIIYERGEGQVGEVDTVTVNYTLFDMSGKELQTTIGSEPMTVNMPNGTIAGFSEGLQLLGKGGKATFYIPAELGYGTSAAQHQLAGQVLKMEIEVLEITPYIEKASNEDDQPKYSKKELREREKLRELLEKYPNYFEEY